MRMKTKNHDWFLLWGLLILVSFCFIGCKDDDGGEKGTSFDPSKPVVISDFIPKEGGWDLVYYYMEIILAMIQLK